MSATSGRTGLMAPSHGRRLSSCVIKAGPLLIRSHFPSRTEVLYCPGMTLETRAPAFAVCRERVVSVDRQRNPPICVLANRANMHVSSVLALHIGIGNEIAFPIPTGGEVGGEVSITKRAVSRGHPDHVYQAPIGYVTQPKDGQTRSVLRFCGSSRE